MVSAPRQEIPITNADLLQHALAEESECSNNNDQICCHQEDIIPNKDVTMPEQNKCQMHYEIGYRYIHSSKIEESRNDKFTFIGDRGI